MNAGDGQADAAGVDAAAAIDALPAQICILDGKANIVATNRAWRAFAAEGGIPAQARAFEGMNYLGVCEGATGSDAEYATRSARGIRAVLAGREPEFRTEYPCDAPDGQARWFRMYAAPLRLATGAGAVVMHTDVTAEYRNARRLVSEHEHFRALFDASPLPMWVFDTETLQFLAVNEAAVTDYGYSRDEFLDMSLDTIRPEAERERLHQYLKERPPDSRQAGLWRHRRRDGREFDVEIFSRAIEFDGRPARLVLARDVTEKLRDERIRAIEARVLAQISTRHDLPTILRSIATGIEQAAPGTIASILLLDPDGRHIRHGAAPGLPETFVRAIDGLEIGPAVGSCGTAMHRGEPVIVDDIRTDPLWENFTELADRAGLRACWSVPVFDTRRQVVGSMALYYRQPRRPEPWEQALIDRFASLVGVAVERQRQDEALEQSERRLRKLFQEAATGIAVIREDGSFLQANGVLAQMLGYAEDELPAHNWHELTHADQRDAVRATMREILAGRREAESLEQRFIARGGGTTWGRVRYSAQTGRDGRPLHLIAVVEDVTAHKHAEEQLEHSRALQRIAGRVGRVGGWAANLEENRVFWSPEMHEILEWEADDPPPLSESLALYPPEHRARIEKALERCSQHGEPFDLELELKTRTGRPIQARAVGEAERDEAGRVRRLIGAFQDITEQKRLQARHEQLAERLEATLENMSDAFLLLDHDWNFVYLNREAERLLRSAREDLVGRNLWDAFPELRDTMGHDKYMHAVEAGEPVRFELYYEPLENWFAVSAFPGPEGLAVYFTVTTETRRLQEQLQQAQRLESIGQLTGGIAHDFNNLLTVIQGNAEMLLESLAADDELAPVAGMIDQAAERGAQLTRRLLAFARRQPLEPAPTDVNELISGMEELIGRALGEPIDIEFARAAGLWPALIDATQLESALMNLAINARDAMPEGGRLTIETANVRIDEDYSGAHEDVAPGQYVLVAVSDTGHGIPGEHLDKVFEPFFTTKKSGHGTGLGLSMVYGFVRQSNGVVNIYSEPGEGTTVRMYLPRAYQGAAAREVEPGGELRGHGECVLVVEDDPQVREFANRSIDQLGYRVVLAKNGDQALRIIADEPDIALLFTDVVMPGEISGRELAEQARRIRPDLPVLYTSGYTENSVIHHGRLDPDVRLLSKPYRREELARALRAALADRPGADDEGTGDEG